MIIPYACSVCGRLDAEGILGHATARCKPLGMVVHKVVHSEPREQKIKRLNKAIKELESIKSKKGVYANKEARKAYRKEWTRKRRADAKAGAA